MNDDGLVTRLDRIERQLESLLARVSDLEAAEPDTRRCASVSWGGRAIRVDPATWELFA